jgi:bifunctional non-homologous end joining protein LigD
MGLKTGSLRFIEPMKARLVEKPPPGDWLYEIKLDGYRTIAIKEGSRVQLYSRNEKDFVGKFPEVAAAVAKLKVREAIIDGEVVALEPSGRSSFQLLQAYDVGEERPPICFYAFDLLRRDGKDLMRLPLVERKAELEKILKGAPDRILFSSSLEGETKTLLEHARKLGLEGLIGKRKDSVYEPGLRSGAWIKLKITFEQEMVIGGYTQPQGGRKYFGSLLVGFYEKGKLYYAGRVGTGFNDASLKMMRRKLDEIRTAQWAFVNIPERKRNRFSPDLTVSEMKKCTWVEPKLVCQVKFTEWTRDGKLRHPVFLGLREDKRAEEVVREIPS